MNANVKIFTDQIDEKSRTQIARLVEQPAFAQAKVRIMPDVHAGMGCVIGFTADLGDKVIPNIVGVDIGCGMYTLCLGKKKPDLPALDEVMHRNIPGGMHAHREVVEEFPELEALRCFDKLKNVPHLRRSLGTLGGGNHFVEVDVDTEGNYYLILHSGSRNLGHQVCEIYQKQAIAAHASAQELREQCHALAMQLRAEGRETEIADAIKALRAAAPGGGNLIPPALCYLEGEGRLDYLHDMAICQRFALRNRELMAEIIIGRLGLLAQDAFHTTHNYIDHESNIVRKGAISARLGERLLIPINMRDGCILGTGKGNDDWNQSAPHGAGRIMSRTAALDQLSLEEFERQMQGIYTTTVSKKTLDEAPMAYKGMDAILGHIDPTVEVNDILKPIYNFKAEEAPTGHRRKREKRATNA